MTLNQHSSLVFVTLILAVQGLGFGFFSSPNMTIIMNSVSSNTVSMASALGAKARSLGMMSGMLITTLLISLSIGNHPVAQYPTRFIETMVTVFSIIAVLTAVALGASILTRTRQ
ncbi:MAG: MFS transporter [bacterium]|nr:MFS transporter [bacterium]